MAYGLVWIDSSGKTVTEDNTPLILLGSVTLGAAEIGKDVKVQFNTGGLNPCWVPVVRTGQNSLGSLLLEKSTLSLNGNQATYIFKITREIFDAPNDASLTIYYGVH